MPTCPVVFQFDQSAVRVVTGADGSPLFSLRDVCEILEVQNPSDIAAKRLDPKGVEKIYTPTPGGSQTLIYVTEPNLYRVIFRSNKPEAARFQDWVFNEVLPAIRKTGSYSTALAPDSRLDLLAPLLRDGVLSAPTAERAALAILGLDPALASGPVAAPVSAPRTVSSPDDVATARGILSALLAGPMMDGLPVSSAIAAALGGSSAAVSSLALHGLRVKGDQLWFGTGIMRLRFMSDAIGVGRDLRKHLLALPGAVRVQTQRFGGVNSKVVAIPLSLVGELPACDGVF